MRLARYTVIVIGLALIIAAATVFMPVETTPKPAGAVAPAFDHSNCQYPDRWSNPANGCDNSDPAVPECIKGMATQDAEAACIAAFVDKYKEADQPAPAEPVSPVTPAAEPAVCGGK